MNDARANILRRLRSNNTTLENDAAHSSTASLANRPIDSYWNKQQQIEHLTQNMQAVRTEVHHLSNGDWLDWLKRELPVRGFKQVLVGDNETGNRVIQSMEDSLKISRYDRQIENWKSELFQDVDVGITTTLGAVAETGSLILWPDKAEPRLMSLVPPVHVALLNANHIVDTFSEAITKLNWVDKTPTNALLISGPSKTSDIEQTLAFGIHGPRQLIVLIFDHK